LIGLSADALLLFNGDVLGASGICSSVLLSHPTKKTLRDPRLHWKLVFLASFVTTSAFLFGPRFELPSSELAPPTSELSIAGYAVAGALVGFGTRLGNGCTSGHGICGLGRLSPRSLTAVLTFLATGIVTAVLTTNGTIELFLRERGRDDEGSGTRKQGERWTWFGTALSVASLAAALAAPLLYRKKTKKVKANDDNEEEDDGDSMAKLGPAAVAGALFSSGLYLSGMTFRSKVLGFLDVTAISDGNWDPTLAAVMGGGVLVSFLGYQFLEPFRVVKVTAPACTYPLALSPKSKFGIPTNRTIDTNLVLGAAVFGAGWGLGHICPGPGMFLAAVGVPKVIAYWWPGFLVGSYVANQVKAKA